MIHTQEYPEGAAAIYREAQRQFRQGNLTIAQDLVLSSLEKDGFLINGYRLLADIHLAQGNSAAACGVLQKALAKLEPGAEKYLAVSVHLAAAHLRVGEQARALTALDSSAVTKSSDVRLLSQAGYIYIVCESFSEALDIYEKAVVHQPQNAELLFNCAASNRAMGNLERAEELYDRVIQLKPEDWEAYKNRADLRKQTADRNHIPQLQALIQQENFPPKAMVQINFALAKELEDLQEFSKNFIALEKGCHARRRLIQYDLSRDLDTMRQIASVFDSTALAKLRADTAQGKGLVFILGMPRTGTTLADRILAALPGVISAGEPDTFARLVSAGVEKIGIADKTEFVRASANIDSENLGRTYAVLMGERAAQKNARWVIDKNPMNFLYVGLISAALPQAKIIHLRRDPVDTCYAIYKTLFKTAYPFSYDQRELGEYYLGYRKLMDHWRSVVTDNFYELDYEKLVENQEAESRKLLEFCGLPWDERCLEFYRSEDSGTATASAAQVRQPVYNSSVGKWKNYRKQLQPLVEVLRSGGITVE